MTEPNTQGHTVEGREGTPEVLAYTPVAEGDQVAEPTGDRPAGGNAEVIPDSLDLSSDTQTEAG